MQNKLYGLDHLRALAIAFVFLFHYQVPLFGHPEWLPNVAKFGWTGVDLFFVLSGFLIASQLFSEIKKTGCIDFKTFFLKRVFRILPAFWTVLALYCCIPFFREREALPPTWKFLTFTQNLGVDLKNAGTFSHAWSLCVEEHFYLLLPLVLLLLLFLKMFHKSAVLLLGLFLFGLVVRMYSWNHFYMPHSNDDDSWLYWYKYVYYPTYNRLDGLLTGVTVAVVYNFLPKVWAKISQYGNLLIIFGLLLLAVSYFVCYEEHSFYASVIGFPLVSFGYGFVVMGAVSPGSILFRWKSKATTFIAMLSYGLYLTHKGMIHITQYVLDYFKIDTASGFTLLICAITCILAAFVLHIAIEKPFMKARDIVLKK
jgi:peptidoglycan/LPS O-acetylase OafA/YrhL